MANRPAAPLELREGDHPRLAAMTRSPTVRAGLAQRARILLLAADGLSNTEIADKVGVSRPTVLVWRQRYVELGIDGLARPVPAGPAAAGVRARRAPGHARRRRRAGSASPTGRRGCSATSSASAAARSSGPGTRTACSRCAAATGSRSRPTLTGRVAAVLALRLGPPESFAVLDVREPSRAADRSDDSAADDALRDLADALRRDAAARARTTRPAPCSASSTR